MVHVGVKARQDGRGTWNCVINMPRRGGDMTQVLGGRGQGREDGQTRRAIDRLVGERELGKLGLGSGS